MLFVLLVGLLVSMPHFATAQPQEDRFFLPQLGPDHSRSGWWVYLRFYAPTKAYFDKSWSIGGDFEKIDR